MGADGHIGIYDREKVEAIGGPIEPTVTIYLQEIFGHRVITSYWGDNLYGDSYNDCMWCGYVGSRYDWKNPCPHDAKMKQVEMEARITEWEVWT